LTDEAFFTEKGVQPSKIKEFFTEKSKTINPFEENTPFSTHKWHLYFIKSVL